ncbi:hypothetical protein M9H77_02673 [Catharanthus roseus]|uniref:Uncharacterized protein n=1 Tax=Catharanthus roseus TaxID=4058 RepID=A0ACC0C987_CATRO|nr:hypothetical protein M9H77_02673 [Catharanthus roseus]
MEEVPAHVHPGPIVPDVLSRQHEHRSGLIWSRDHETYYTDLQCRRFGRNLFQCYSMAPLVSQPLFRIQGEEGTIGSMDLRAFTGSETDDDLILRACGFIFLLIGGHLLPDFSRNLVHVRYLSLLEGSCARQHWRVYDRLGGLSLSTYLGVNQTDPLAPLGAIWRTSFDCSQLPTYTLVTYRDQLDFMPSDQFARAQMVPEACDTRLDLHQIQLKGNDHTYWGTKDGPAVVAEALSYPSDEYIRWNHLHLLHRWPCLRRKCRRLSGGVWSPSVPSCRRPRKHVQDRGVRGVKRGARRHPGRGVGGGRPPVPPAPERHEHVDPGHVEVERGERSGSGRPPVDPFDSPNLDMPSFSLGLTPADQSLPSGSGTLQTPLPPGLGFASFQAPYSTSYGFTGFGHPLFWAQPVHLHRISLYRRHLHLMKRSGRMTWMVYNVTD